MNYTIEQLKDLKELQENKPQSEDRDTIIKLIEDTRELWLRILE